MLWADASPDLGRACDCWVALSLEMPPSDGHLHSCPPSASSCSASRMRRKKKRIMRPLWFLLRWKKYSMWCHGSICVWENKDRAVCAWVRWRKVQPWIPLAVKCRREKKVLDELCPHQFLHMFCTKGKKRALVNSKKRGILPTCFRTFWTTQIYRFLDMHREPTPSWHTIV